MKKIMYAGIVLMLPAFMNAQNVRVVKTSTQPETKQVNNSPVLVIPKTEPTKNNSNLSNQNSGQNNNSSKKVPAVRKVENRPNTQGNNSQRKQAAQPVR